MKEAIAYYRVSSDEQRKNMNIDMQQDEVLAWADDEGYSVVAEYSDNGISGETIKERPGFLKAKEHIQTGEVDVLLVWAVDRIGRFVKRSLRAQVIELLEESKTDVHILSEEHRKLYRHNNEEEMDELEASLVESRAENRRRGRRIRSGHRRTRRAGGRRPYGVMSHKPTRDEKERGKQEFWHIVPEEMSTVKELLTKLSGGWGLRRTRDYLNTNPRKFPKRPYKWKGREVKEWSDVTIRNIIVNDFYKDGVIRSCIEGGLAVDTGLKADLIECGVTEELVAAARTEMQVRRHRYHVIIDKEAQRTGKPGRPKGAKHGQDSQTVFTDALFHGIARCSYCGNRLGINKKGKYTSYVCWEQRKGRCDFKQISARRFDPKTWSAFLKGLEDPEEIKRMILEEQLIMAKDVAEKETLLEQNKRGLTKLKGARERLRKQHIWGHIGDEEYKLEMERLNRLRKQHKERIENLTEALERPAETEKAIKNAITLLAERLDVLEFLEKVKGITEQVEDYGALAKERKNLYLELDALAKQVRWLEEIERLMSEFKQSLTTPNRNEAIDGLIFQQRRAILHRFLDFDTKDEDGKDEALRVENHGIPTFNFLLKSPK